jgi:hypothetical protein
MIKQLSSLFQKAYTSLLSEKTKHIFEKIILSIAIASFFIHLIIIWLVDFGLITIQGAPLLFTNTISAIYTPFSFILVYEVYLLIYYLPKSITTYISKQYEIISLIIIRRLFKDLSELTFSNNWFNIKYDLQFTYDLIASVLLFILIYQFYVQNKKRYRTENISASKAESISTFIKIKKIIATLLVPALFFAAIYSFFHWIMSVVSPSEVGSISLKNINNIFFEQFFSMLIIADVILLLFSFFHTDEFHKVIRNSGFIISTILIRLSFAATGLLNTALIISAVVFGLVILIIHNQFEKKLSLQENLNNHEYDA